MALFRKKEKKEKNLIVKTQELSEKEKLYEFYENRKTAKEAIAPFGVNPNPYQYMIVDDNGIPLYTMCFYINTLPKKVVFASTFKTIFDYPEVTTNVFIAPLPVGESSRKLDKRIISLDTERLVAENSGDRNRLRKIMAKLADAESFAVDVESGDNRLYEVQFLVTVQAVDLEKLYMIVNDLHTQARTKGVELASCYSVHPEAFVSGYTTNRLFKASYGLINSSVVKTHIFDKGALCTIFNHTHAYFGHDDGIVIGRNMSTGNLCVHNIYDPSHMGYGMIASGKTGTGKSATIKMWLSRYEDFDYYIRSIDFERRGTHGEYSIMAETTGGINYQIGQNSDNIMNIFELEEEDEYDESTGLEYTTLNLSQKIVDVSNQIMVMIRQGEDINDFELGTSIKRIVVDTISELYMERNIIEGEPSSLYESGMTLEDGKLTSGKIKKLLPTITDFYKKILIKKSDCAEEELVYDGKAFHVILSSMKDYVRELYYCPHDIEFFTKDEYENTPIEKTKTGQIHICPHCKKRLKEIRGVRAYFDGQSTLKANRDTIHINIDLSQLTEEERKVAMLVAMLYFQEQHIKKNSANPNKAKKMIFMIDEGHKCFGLEEARIILNDTYRTARKRNVAPLIITQALADFAAYEETKALVKNSTTILMFKQSSIDRDFIRQSTPLTETEIETVIGLGGDPDDPQDSDERKGELCIIDNNKVAFIKVDYLTDSEANIVETDITKLKKMFEGRKVV